MTKNIKVFNIPENKLVLFIDTPKKDANFSIIFEHGTLKVKDQPDGSSDHKKEIDNLGIKIGDKLIHFDGHAVTELGQVQRNAGKDIGRFGNEHKLSFQKSVKNMYLL